MFVVQWVGIIPVLHVLDIEVNTYSTLQKKRNKRAHQIYTIQFFTGSNRLSQNRCLENIHDYIQNIETNESRRHLE